MLQLFKNHKMLFTVAFVTVLFISCANMGQGPQGGPYDFDSPALINASPKLNTTNFDGEKLELYFNENVVIKDANDRVIITPPQKRMPIIRSANKKITVELRDTLKENTTYTIDFTDAIRDNNQDNPLENFSFSFSTGDVIDSLMVSGIVIQARDNEPIKGYFVGLHSNIEDSAFTKLPFDRISKTNDKGEFTIRGIAPGKYRLFALDDKNRDYVYDNPMEGIAFHDFVVEPGTMEAERADTIFADPEKLLVDSIKRVKYTKYIPNDIVLKSFHSNEKKEYFRNAERKGAKTFTLYFGAATQTPKLEPLNFDSSINWGVLEQNVAKDSVYTYWIKDESILKMDTLLFNMTYNMTDTLNNLVSKTDSLQVVNRERKLKIKKEEVEEDKEKEIVFLSIKSNLKSTWDIYDDITLEFEEPIKEDSLRSLISFQQKVDTLFNDVEFGFEADSLNPRKYKIQRKWKYNEQYRITIDSASVHGIYGLWNNKFKQEFKVKDEDQYSNLAITVSGINDTVPSFMELLDSSGKPIRKGRVIDNVALFRNVNPAKYYTRLIIDTNGNNEWDTGNYTTKTQPEQVYYYPEHLELKAYWNHEETFVVDIDSHNKPADILKNKPQDKSSREKLLQEQDSERYEKEKEEKRRQEEQVNPFGRSRAGTSSR